MPFAGAAVLAIWRRAWDALRLQAVAAVLVPVSWISMARISGLPYFYLSYWLMVVAAYLVLSTVWSVVCSLWPASTSAAIVPTEVGTRRSVVPAAIAAVALVVFAAGAVARVDMTQVGGTDSGGVAVGQFAAPAAEAIAGRGLVLITASLPNVSNGRWTLETSAIESGLQAELARRGLDVTTTNARLILVGQDGVVGDRPIAGRLIVTALTGARPADASGATTLATSDSLSPAERHEYQTLDERHDRGHLTPTELARWEELKGEAVLYRLTYRPVVPS